VKFNEQAWENVAPVNNIWKASLYWFSKSQFDVAIRKSFFVISAFISNDKDEILTACIAKISSMEVNLGVEKAALLASNLASSYGRIPLILKMDSLIVIIGINQQSISISLQ